MPMLLEDLAEETSSSNRRAASRLDEEVREFDESRRAASTLEELRQKATDSAHQATSYAVSRLSEAESVWQLALTALRKHPTGKDSERLLRAVIGVFESGIHLLRSPRALWEVARQLGAEPERKEDLDRAECQFRKLAEQARKALEHRLTEWKPADPARLALGLKLAREGKTITADEARAWFRGRQS